MGVFITIRMTIQTHNMYMKKRICFVVSSVFTASAFLRDHIEALSAEYDVYLVGNFTTDNIAILKEMKLVGYKSIEIHRNIHIFKDLKSVFDLKDYLNRGSFFATHSVTPKAGLISAIASYLAKTPHRIHIFTGQVWHTKQGLFKWMLKFLDKVIAKLNTHILVDGESQRQFLIENKIIKEASSFVLGKGSISGVNIDRFKANPEIRLKFRRALKLDDKIVFGFLGRLNHDKGVDDLFEAYNRLCSELSNVYLLIIGSDEENMMSLVSNFKYLKLDVNFTYYGIAAEAEKILQALDVFCLPSYREGFGTSVLEAESLGIPVICSDTYGLMDAMLEGVTGLRHKVGQSNDLYNKMKFMAENEELRKKMGVNAAEYVLKNFSGAKITNEWLKFYHQIGQ